MEARIAEDLPVFNQLAFGMKIGTVIKLTGLRNDKPMRWNLKTAARESAFAKERELKSWGLTVRRFTLMSSLEARRPNKSQVHSVGRGGPSYGAKPMPIPRQRPLAVNGEAVANVEDLIRFPKKERRGKNQPVPTLVSLERDLADLLTVVKIGPEAEENRPLQAWKPWVGVSTQVLTRELSEALELPLMTKGVRVVQVCRTLREKGGDSGRRPFAQNGRPNHQRLPD